MKVVENSRRDSTPPPERRLQAAAPEQITQPRERGVPILLILSQVQLRGQYHASRLVAENGNKSSTFHFIDLRINPLALCL